MAYKPEIQYVGQFYTHGSEALAPKKAAKKAPAFLEKEKTRKVRKVYLDPVAFCGILVAVVMLTALVLGAVQLYDVWQDHYAMEEYVSQLKRENAELAHNYHISYDLDEIRKFADTLGLVPMEEVESRTVRVTIPEPEPERTWWDNVLWFFDGLFA